jgi:signal transduction histidine kinase
MGAHRHLGLSRPRVEWIVWGVWAAGAVVLATVPAPWLVSTTLGVYGTGIAMGAYAVGAFLRHRRQTAPRVAIGFVAVGLGFFAFVLHDALSIAGARLLPILLVPYTFTLIVVAETVTVIARLLRAWDGLIALNRDLEARVAAKSAELEQSWARVRDLERERIVSDERRRITRDIHDGLGGHLVTTLAMLESEDEFSRDDVAEALRGALDDLRMVIDSLDPRETDLVGVLATIRGRIEPRLRRRGLRFRWDVNDVPPSAGLGPERLLRVLRIVQEAITNVLKHAQATTITVRTGTDDGRVWVSVGDDGQGFAPAHVEGRGLVNMRRRAAELGGALTIDTGPDGTTVMLRLPG